MEKKLVYLIGTSHRFQIRTPAITKGENLEVRKEWIDAFQDYLHKAAQSLEIKTIAEEYSEDHPIFRCEGAASIAKVVADLLQLKHRFCEPNVAECISIGLMSQNDRDKDEENGFPIRENFWLKRIEPLLLVGSLIFICGAKHIDTFMPRLRSQDLSATVYCRDWAPQPK